MAKSADVAGVVDNKENTKILDMAHLRSNNLANLQIAELQRLGIVALNHGSLQTHLRVALIFLIRDDLASDELIYMESGLPVFDVLIREMADPDIGFNMGTETHIYTITGNMLDEATNDLMNVDINDTYAQDVANFELVWFRHVVIVGQLLKEDGRCKLLVDLHDYRCFVYLGNTCRQYVAHLDILEAQRLASHGRNSCQVKLSSCDVNRLYTDSEGGTHGEVLFYIGELLEIFGEIEEVNTSANIGRDVYPDVTVGDIVHKRGVGRSGCYLVQAQHVRFPLDLISVCGHLVYWCFVVRPGCDWKEAEVARVMSTQDPSLNLLIHLEVCRGVLLVWNAIPPIKQLRYRNSSLHVVGKLNIELRALDRLDTNSGQGTKLDVIGR
ncbi:rrna biogenesis protein rrp5 [Pyrenophora tritici-repentis]|nr:rrna biogenesis protein rrp5 [Pyrenophora tritici-repentis]KAF7449483.1 rrna biogenesis protein rrp5 [Pyrenophora tritici-repentis]KAG9383575.1 rrna biogenesis protein rrp5 [Pyrenophora tritici-repentis]KAI1524736.1 RpsA Ribosomal protein S1 [Pyrenophora tritici-repentis]KAI1525111.1 RpsA Ribosomal protein S1 [Pyrenophora tritici-repentis]